jgi:hypothetical protein
MDKLFEIGQLINTKRLSGDDIIKAFEFLKNLPMIGNHFDTLKKT